MRGQEAPDGRKFAAAEEEGAVGHVVHGDDRAFRVGDDVILAVDARHSRWVPRVQKFSAPHRWDRWLLPPASYLSHRVHELDQTRCVTHGVVQTEREYETPALQARYLHALVCFVNSRVFTCKILSSYFFNFLISCCSSIISILCFFIMLLKCVCATFSFTKKDG